MDNVIKQYSFAIIRWLVVLVVSLPLAAQASNAALRNSDIVAANALVFVFFAIVFGAITATFIPTAVDKNMRNPTIAKLFIGASFGCFGTIALLQQMPDLMLLSAIFPAYLLAAIGAY